MENLEQPTTEQAAPQDAGSGGTEDADLAAVEAQFTPETDDTPQEGSESDATDGEGEGGETVDPDELDLGDGLKAKRDELRSVYELYKGSPDAQKMRAAYLQAREQIATERKSWETQKPELERASQTLDTLNQRFESDPARYAADSLWLAVENGMIDKSVAEAVEGILQQAQQQGGYNPAVLQAKAAQQQANRERERLQGEQRASGMKAQVWQFQESLGRILSPEEKQQLYNVIEYTYSQTGQMLPFDDAWKKLQSLQPPRPVAQPSPAKQALALRNKKPTLERATGRSGAGAHADKAYKEDMEYLDKWR